MERDTAIVGCVYTHRVGTTGARCAWTGGTYSGGLTRGIDAHSVIDDGAFVSGRTYLRDVCTVRDADEVSVLLPVVQYEFVVLIVEPKLFEVVIVRCSKLLIKLSIIK